MLAFSLPWPWRRRPALRRRGLSTTWYEANDRKRILWLTVAAVVSAVVLGNLTTQIGVAAVVIPAAAAALAAILWRPRIGLFAILALVMLFEMTSPDPLMAPGRY